ncbi:MAG: ABC transporter substrate-binding protein [Candidatus Omnitrophota bacterium]
MKAKVFLFVILFVALLIYAPALAEKRFSSRIISLGPSITESLYLLGEGERIIAVTTYCRRPIEARKKERIGTIRESNVEKIISLRPDLVIATSLTNPRIVEKLRKIGVKVVVFSEPKNFALLCEQFLELAALIGKEEDAARVLKEATTRINALREKVRGLGSPTVFIQVGAKPLFAATGNTFINDFVVFAGAHNIAGDAASGLYSREEVLKRNPEVIFIVTMGISGEEEKTVWEKYRTLDAVRNKRIYFIDSDKACSPTPLGFAETLEEIVLVLHPELEER